MRAEEAAKPEEKKTEAPAAEEAKKPDAPAPKRLDKVTVAATKSERNADFTPGEVGIVSREELQIRQPGTVEDVVKYLPGTEAIQGPRRIGQQPNIRGLDGPRVLVTVDGARMNFSSGHKGQTFVEPDYLKTVEVVRGPGSALYGSSALGGVMAMTTISPDDFLGKDDLVGFKVRGGYKGGEREWMWQPTVYGRLGREGAGKKVEYLLSYTGRDAEDLRIGNGNSNLLDSAERIASGLGKIVGKPTKHDIASFSAMVFNDTQKSPANTTVDTAPETPATSTLVDRTTRQTSYTLKYDHIDPADLLNFSLTAYRNEMRLKEDRVFEANQLDENGYKTWGVDARHSMTFRPGPATLRVTTGLEFYRDSQISESNRGAASAEVFFPEATADHLAPYIQGEFSFYDDLFVLIPGVRYTKYSMDSNNGSQETSNWSPKVGALIKLDDEIGLQKGDYWVMEGNYGEAFRAPTFGELFISGTHFNVVEPIAPGFNFVTFGRFIPNPDLKPETGKN
ncbi:MAG: TonB-dependent receptor, partial [Planctomycetota bacterium]|nr:TonB-dependent receptor [Planctomycetota bacterium]